MITAPREKNFFLCQPRLQLDYCFRNSLTLKPFDLLVHVFIPIEKSARIAAKTSADGATVMRTLSSCTTLSDSNSRLR